MAGWALQSLGQNASWSWSWSFQKEVVYKRGSTIKRETATRKRRPCSLRGRAMGELARMRAEMISKIHREPCAMGEVARMRAEMI